MSFALIFITLAIDNIYHSLAISVRPEFITIHPYIAKTLRICLHEKDHKSCPIPFVSVLFSSFSPEWHHLRFSWDGTQ